MISGYAIHHYGFAASDLAQTSKTFGALGYVQQSEVFVDPIQKVKLCFLARPGEPLIELIADLGEDGPTRKIIAQSGNSFYHVCYEVDNLDEALSKLRELSFLIRHQPIPAVAFGGRRIAWVYHRHMGLVELLEK